MNLYFNLPSSPSSPGGLYSLFITFILQPVSISQVPNQDLLLSLESSFPWLSESLLRPVRVTDTICFFSLNGI